MSNKEILQEERNVRNDATALSPEDWGVEYEECLKNPPEEGSCMVTEGYVPKDIQPEDYVEDSGTLVGLEIDCTPGRSPFIFARAYVRSIVGCWPEWFLYDMTEESMHGFKVILHAKSRDAVLRKFGLKLPKIGVHKLKILGLSKSKQSLIAHVEEW